MVRNTLLAYFCGLSFILLFLAGCASSDVSREAAANMDKGVQKARSLVEPSDMEFADAYQNASQATKGALLGGAAGALTGAITSVGFIPGTATGILLGASYGSYIDSKATLKDQLENRGAVIVVLGDQILIVLPSSRIFQSACYSTIKSQAYPTLALVARYINGFTKMLVKVSAYSNRSGSSQQDLLLTKHQAQNVAKALMVNGIDTRVLYAEGYGGTHLVEQNTLEDDSDNNRIEITLEKLYV